MSSEGQGLLGKLGLFTAQTPLKGDAKLTYSTAEDREEKSLVRRIVDGVKTGTQKSIESVQNVYEGTITTGRRLKFFFLYLVLAALCLFASTFFLPTLLLFPEQFALLFTLSGICVHIALSYLQLNQFDYVSKVLLTNGGVSAVYFAGVVGTLWFAVVAKSYVMVLGCVGVQAGAVVWFFFSLFPGGTTGLKAVMRYGLRMCCFCGDESLPLPI